MGVNSQVGANVKRITSATDQKSQPRSKPIINGTAKKCAILRFEGKEEEVE